jgi:hypothetical protein
MTLTSLTKTSLRLAGAALVAGAIASIVSTGQASAAPPAPVVTNAQALNPNDMVVLFWDSSTNETAFEIAEFDYFGNNQYKLRRVVSLPAYPGTGERAHSVSGLTPGTSYCFRVRAVLPPLPPPSFVNTTDWSDDKCATTYGTAPSGPAQSTPFCLACRLAEPDIKIATQLPAEPFCRACALVAQR